MYAVLADIITAIGEDALLAIADRDGDGNVDADIVAEALLDASAEIDGAVGARYKLPINPVPRRLKRIAVDLAQYHLDSNPTENLEKRAKAARDALKNIANGTEELRDAVLAGTGEEPDGGGSGDDLPEVGQFQGTLDTDGYT